MLQPRVSGKASWYEGVTSDGHAACAWREVPCADLIGEAVDEAGVAVLGWLLRFYVGDATVWVDLPPEDESGRTFADAQQTPLS